MVASSTDSPNSSATTAASASRPPIGPVWLQQNRWTLSGDSNITQSATDRCAARSRASIHCRARSAHGRLSPQPGVRASAPTVATTATASQLLRRPPRLRMSPAFLVVRRPD